MSKFDPGVSQAGRDISHAFANLRNCGQHGVDDVGCAFAIASFPEMAKRIPYAPANLLVVELSVSLCLVSSSLNGGFADTLQCGSLRPGFLLVRLRRQPQLLKRQPTVKSLNQRREHLYLELDGHLQFLGHRPCQTVEPVV